MNIDKKYVVITLPTGEKYGIHASVVLLDHAKYYAKNYHGDVSKSLELGSRIELADHSSILDWAQNNMDWSEIESLAVKLSDSDDKLVKRLKQALWANDSKVLDID